MCYVGQKGINYILTQGRPEAYSFKAKKDIEKIAASINSNRKKTAVRKK
jgi:hypothetical protein